MPDAGSPDSPTSGHLWRIESGPPLRLTVRVANGCSTAFMFVWLIGWTYGLVALLTGSDPHRWRTLPLMGIPWLAVIAFLIWSLKGRHILELAETQLTLRRHAIRTWTTNVIPLDRIRSIGVRKPGNKQSLCSLFFQCEHGLRKWEVVFAPNSFSAEDAAQLAHTLQSHVESRSHHKLASEPLAQALRADPQLLQKQNDDEGKKPLNRIAGIFTSIVSVGFAVLWNVAVWSMVVGMIRMGSYLPLIIAIPFAAIGLYLAFVALAIVATFIFWLVAHIRSP